MSIDGYRFQDAATRRVMRTWLDRESLPADIPWSPPRRSLAESRVAFVSTAGIARLDDVPFDQEGERRNPWWGDSSYRVLPREVTTNQVRIYHLHIDPRPAAVDLDCVLPLRRLDELVARGVVGSSSDRHFSIMGYVLDTADLTSETAPKIADALVEDQVDLALLIPV